MTTYSTTFSKYRPITDRSIIHQPFWSGLDEKLKESIEVVSKVLPFRTNSYVVEELIDWARVPDDPIFQLTFAQREMLEPEAYEKVRALLAASAPKEDLERLVQEIRLGLNPHPAGQLDANVPTLDGRRLAGLQHKYQETVLFFPTQGQTCHAYCTYCFRWAQFVGMPDLRFASREVGDLVAYLKAHPEVTDVLITGGDPLIMKTEVLRRYIEPLLDPELEHLQNIRIGTKALAYWPQRFVGDDDADDLLRLFEQVTEAGRHLAIMGHYSHPVELATDVAQEAVRRVRATGAEIRLQAPVVRHVNDRSDVWAELWTTAVGLGIIPYYFFVERDTGPKRYFEIPLAEVYQIFSEAYRRVSGLARSVRGPSMSAHPGKARVVGIEEVAGQKVFVLEFLQARDPSWALRPFFAEFDPEATWLDQLKPAFGQDRFFFEQESAETEARPLLRIVG